jgi:hypothetical protein
VLLLLAAATPSFALEAADEEGVWTVIIPDAFPRYIYTWHLNVDGSYAEDGRDAATDKSIQSTLHGRWTRNGAQMVLRQDGLPYVFDGVVVGNVYSGTMYFNDRSSSRFCAAKGEQPPERCNPGQGVAMITR